MNISNQQKLTFAAVLFCMTALVGCGNKDQPEKPAYDAAPPTVKPAETAPAPADKSVRYYSEHLSEAEAVWDECLKRGPANMSDEEKKNCANAQSAWEMQPYKARK